jgi:hypothetical protein
MALNAVSSSSGIVHVVPVDDASLNRLERRDVAVDSGIVRQSIEVAREHWVVSEMGLVAKGLAKTTESS